MDLFSTENFSLEEKLNNQKNNITQLTETYQQSDSVSNPSDIIQIVKGKKMVNTIKRKDHQITDQGNIVFGDKKHKYGLKWSDLKDKPVAIIASSIKKKSILNLNAEYLINEKRVPQDVAIAAELLEKKISNDPVFSSMNLTEKDCLQFYEKYMEMLTDIQDFVENAATIDELKGLTNKMNIKYLEKEQRAVSTIILLMGNESIKECKSITDSINLLNNRCMGYSSYKNVLNFINTNKENFTSIQDIISQLSTEFKYPLLNSLSKKTNPLSLDYKLLKETEYKLSINHPFTSEEDLWKTRIKIGAYITSRDSTTGKEFMLKDTKDKLLDNREDPTTRYSNIIRYKTMDEAIEGAKKYYVANYEIVTKKLQLKKEKLVPEKRVIYEILPQATTYTSDELFKTFKLSALQFGNYQNNRQIVLDNTYIALTTLSKAMGVSPEFISGGGTLALSYGARGNPGATAHYEPNGRIINFTKGDAGSAAHELGHALDHIMGEILMEKNKILVVKDGVYLTNINSHNYDKNNKFAKNLIDLITDLKKSFISLETNDQGIKINTKFYSDSKMYDQSKSKPYWATEKEMFARAFEVYISDKIKENPCYYLVSGVTEEICSSHKTSVYPIGKERQVINSKMEKLIEFISENEIELMKPVVELNQQRTIARELAKKASIKSKKDDLEIS